MTHNIDRLRNKRVTIMTDGEISIFPEDKRFYDQGWNARCDFKPYQYTTTIDWRDGWNDSQKVPDKERIKMV